MVELALGVVPLVAVVEPAAGHSWMAAGLAAVVALCVAGVARRVRGTTLTAAVRWGVAGLVAVATVEAYLALRGSAVSALTASLLRYGAAVGTCCPVVAVLGAKRPQDRGWQWVVLTLWVILLAPVAQAMVAPASERLELAPLWRLMLLALLAMGLLNYLPTRYGFAAGLAVLGQVSLLAPFLFNLPPEQHAGRIATGVCLLFAAGAVAEISRPKWIRRGNQTNADELPEVDRLQRRWLAFRDSFGAFWALRVMQRVNHAAEQNRWPVRLQWHGFAPVVPTDKGDAEFRLAAATTAQIEQPLNSLLRRFEKTDR